jgi:diguanylate cyclase (GGDEF)-like protein/PAS domain S-box-containing protein
MHTLLDGPLFEHSPDAILIAATNSVVLDVNAEFTRLTGYTREEIVGKTPRLLKSGRMSAAFYRALWQTVLSGRRWRNDILNRRKDGSLYWADEIIQPITLEGETVLVSFQRDITELRRTRDALAEERARLDGFLRASPAVLYAVPATGTTQPLFVSDNVKDLLGNLPLEPCSDPHWWLERIHPEDREAVVRTLDFRRWPDDTLLRRYRLRHADGHYVWVEDKVTLVRDERGEPRFLSGALLDVSREAEQRTLLEKLARHLPGVIYLFKRTPDDHVSFPYASEGMRRICGIDPEAVREDATPFFASVHPEDQAAMREASDHSRDTLEPWRLLYRHVHPDGQIVWAEGESTPERQPDGSTLWYGFIADVTARVEAERKLREQEALYRTVLDHLQEIYYVAEVTPEGFRFRAGNAKLYELLGLAPERWIGSSPRDLFPPHVAERMEKNLRRCLEEGRTLRTETAMATAHGWRKFSTSITPLFDEHGRARYLVGLVMDVTEYKHAIRRAQEASKIAAERAQTLETLLNAAGEGIFGIDTDGAITFWNPAAERILGYRAGEVLGLDAHQTIHSRHPDGTPHPRQECPVLRAASLENKSTIRMESYFLHRNGTPIPVLLTATPVPGSGAVVVFTDITQIKAMQDELRLQAETDPLTGLANRRRFFNALRLAGERVARKGDHSSVLMLDLDRFKAVNDRYGHAVGDAVLRSFAAILRAALRSSDLAGRVGGEEFAVLLPHTDLAGAVLLAERIRHAVAAYCRVPEHPELRMTVSIGVSELLPEDPSPEAALARADAALYAAKQAGRNRVMAARTDDEDAVSP